MRVSCEENDPGFESWIKNKDVKVFLNGIEQKDCITADTDEGMVKRYIVDELGNVKLTMDGEQAQIEIEIVYGKVEIQ